VSAKEYPTSPLTPLEALVHAEQRLAETAPVLVIPVQ